MESTILPSELSIHCSNASIVKAEKEGKQGRSKVIRANLNLRQPALNNRESRAPVPTYAIDPAIEERRDEEDSENEDNWYQNRIAGKEVVTARELRKGEIGPYAIGVTPM